MQIIEGNILDVEYGVIVQQVNCMGVMGAGLAKQIIDRWPMVYNDYVSKVRIYSNRADLLGKIQTIVIEEDKLAVVNMFSQYSYGRNGVYTDYEAFANCLNTLKACYNLTLKTNPDIKIYFPYGIGCGLAGGDWNKISKLIEEHLPEAIIIKYKEKK